MSRVRFQSAFSPLSVRFQSRLTFINERIHVIWYEFAPLER
jgi:hypothetical protein